VLRICIRGDLFPESSHREKWSTAEKIDAFGLFFRSKSTVEWAYSDHPPHFKIKLKMVPEGFQPFL
jgi:hypothetical protein